MGGHEGSGHIAGVKEIAGPVKGKALFQQQAGHHGLAGAGVVGEQKTHARQLDELVVDRLKLVRQRIDARNREREVRVVLVGGLQPHRLDAQAEAKRIAIVGLLVGGVPRQ